MFTWPGDTLFPLFGDGTKASEQMRAECYIFELQDFHVH